MPTLTIMSVYNARKAMYADQLARARAELEEFKAGASSPVSARRRLMPSGSGAHMTEDMFLRAEWKSCPSPTTARLSSRRCGR